MSAEIKNTIGLLCKLINLVYQYDLKPEHFRLAKFNKTDENIVPTLWNALGTILNENNPHSIEKRLQYLNYNRKQFYILKPDDNSGSRELLLALTFIISEKLELDLQEKLNRSLLTDNMSRQSNLSGGKCEHETFNWQKLLKHNLQNYKKWLCGKICSNSDMMSEYKQQINKIQAKYNKCLDIKAHSELTVYEILALKNRKVGEQFLHDTEPVVHMMMVYTDWIKKEKQFWKWMNTVLEEAEKQHS